MRKALVGGAAALFAVSSFLFLPGEGQECGIRTAEAASLRTADRELKRRKNYEPSNLYQRAHRIIWGKGKAVEDRVRIAVVINGDENIIVENRVKNQIYSQLREKFPLEDFAVMKGTDVNTKLLQYAEDVYYDQRETAMTSETSINSEKVRSGVEFGVTGRLYRNSAADSVGISESFGFGEESRSTERSKVMKPSRVDVNGVPVGMQPRGLADMRCADYVRAGKECDYDYVFVMTFSNGKARAYNHDFILFNTTSVEKNVWMCVRFVDVANEDYLYRNDIVAQGEATNGYVNGRVIARSVKNAVQEALDDIAIDY